MLGGYLASLLKLGHVGHSACQVEQAVRQRQHYLHPLVDCLTACALAVQASSFQERVLSGRVIAARRLAQPIQRSPGALVSVLPVCYGHNLPVQG